MKNEIAIFGAGCFWAVEQAFRKIPGVVDVEVGFSGGNTEAPSYEQVCSGSTGHAEVVKVEFNPNKISFKKLLDFFWDVHDPTQLNKQGLDVGSQYRSVIFYSSDKQRRVAEDSKQKQEVSEKYKSSIVTDIERAGEFYRAEEYHQRYLEKARRESCFFR